jgi:ABC-type Fe3+-hydroxamate transport system substrate-binding protein
VVSLVPSLTEAVFDLGAGSTLVACTRYCTRPDEGVRHVESVGGTKDPDVDRVVGLAPDVVLASREENTRRRIEAIARRVPVLVTDPAGPHDVPALWRELGAVCGREALAEEKAREVEAELARVSSLARGDAPGFVYWIWREPWMAAGHDTYISELLGAAGWRNVLPAEHRRYPQIDPVQASELGARALLFSTEPYPFELPRDLAAFPGHARLENGVWRLAAGLTALAVDGALFSWYPSLTAEGLRRAVSLLGVISARSAPSSPPSQR